MITREYFALGTAIKLSVADDASLADIQAAYTLIKHYENLLTVNRPESAVMDINHNAGRAPVQVDAIVYTLIERAVAASRRNLGMNVAIGPLVKLWGIGFAGAQVPTAAAINARLALTTPTQITLSAADQSVYLQQAGMELDLGAIAKGYIADAIRTLWQERGVAQGIINLGGNILLVGPGNRANGAWRIGIQNPDQGRDVPLGILTTSARSIVTSGIYERVFEQNGHTYHHIFDPETGYPVQNDLASVTIVSTDSIDGDIWTTFAFAQGLTAGLALVEGESSIEAIFVTQNGQIEVTSGLQASFEQIN